MSPDVSRRLGLIVGRHWVSPDERDRIISATLDAEDWVDIPQKIRDLLAEIGKRGALPTPDDEPALDQIRAMAEQDDELRSDVDDDSLRLRGILVDRAAGHDVTPGHDQLHHYWTRGEGLALWTTWTELYDHLVRHVGPLKAKVFASDWFRDRYGYSAGSDLNRVRHGKSPRGDRIGPG